VKILQIDGVNDPDRGDRPGSVLRVLPVHGSTALAMRATARRSRSRADARHQRETAFVALVVAIAGVVAVLGGTMLGAGAGPATGLGAGIAIVALRALPAMVLGGLDSHSVLSSEA